MKISLNTLRRYRDMYDWSGDPAPRGIDDLLARIGAQLGGIEETQHIGRKYSGVVIAKVVSCDDHPNADRLHVCMIDDGGVVPDVARNEDGLVQVVCGAPNVTAGVTVAWLPPGSTVPSSFDSDPFVLEARELRGVVSNGMLASPKELAIGDSHEGLLLIDEPVEAGTYFADQFGLRDDVVFDIENKMFTHRPDCFGWMGVAREIAGIQGMPFTSPEWYGTDAELPTRETDELPLDVRNEVPELVPRFTAITMRDVQIAPSPVWLQTELARVGLRPINNVVDLTNYLMLFTGQPLHAYDYDKVVAQDDGADRATIIVRKPHDGEKLKLLNGKEIVPRSEGIMIATRDRLIGLGGVMGGADTEVDDSTRNIIIECANFDMYDIRRTSMAHGAFTDAVTRFNKGQSPLQAKTVLARMVTETRELAGGKVASDLIDDNHMSEESLSRNAVHADVVVDANFVNDRLGLQISVSEMAALLTNVEFVVGLEGETLNVRAPFWRTDIEIPEDVVEEIGRLYGFDKLPLKLPSRPISPAAKNTELTAIASIRDVLSRAGANEVLSYSFVHGNLLTRTGQDPALAYKLTNALSPELQYYRLSLTPSLLEKVHQNIKAGYDAFGLFEIGKVHSKSEIDETGLPKEFGRVAFTYAAAPRKGQAQVGAPYYQAVQYLRTLLPQQGRGLTFVPVSQGGFEDHALFQQLLKPYEPNRAAYVYHDGKLLGVVGEYRQAIHKVLKLPAITAGFELFLKPFESLVGSRSDYVALPRFPKVSQDITLRVAADLPFKTIYDTVHGSLGAATDQRLAVNLEAHDIYQAADDQAHKHVSLRLTVASYDRTLTDTEVHAMLDRAASFAADTIGAERI